MKIINKIESLMCSEFRAVNNWVLVLNAEFTKYKYKCIEPKELDGLNHIRIVINENNDWIFEIIVNNQVSEKFNGNGLEQLLDCVIDRLFKMGINYGLIYKEYKLDNNLKYEIIKRSRCGQSTSVIKNYLNRVLNGEKEQCVH